MKTKLFAANFIPILAQTSGDLAGGASKALGIVMLIGFIFGTICVIGGGFAIRRGDTDAGKLSIIGGLIIAGAPVIVKALFTAFGIDSSTVDVGAFHERCREIRAALYRDEQRGRLRRQNVGTGR